MCTPEEDLLSWGAILASCIEDGQLDEMLSDFNRLVTDFVETGTLPPPNSDLTEYFLNTIVKSTAAGILNFGTVYYNQKPLVTATLACLTNLFTWAFVHDNFNLLASVQGVLDEKSNIYYASSTTYYVSEMLGTTVRTFLLSDGPGEIVKRVNDEEKMPALDHFEVLYRTYYGLISVSSNLGGTVMETVPGFKRFLTQLSEDGFKNIDLTKLWKTVKDFMEYASREAPHESGIFEFLFDLGESMMAMDINRQIVGGQILVFGAKGWGNVADAFAAWQKRTKLVDVLIEKDLHLQLLEVIEGLFEKLLGAKSLEVFMEKAENAHSSERSIMLGIAGRALRNLSSEELCTFVTKIRTRENLSDEMIRFLVSSLSSMTADDADVCNDIVDALIEMSRDETKAQVVISGFKALGYQSNRFALVTIVNKLIDRLQLGEMLYFCASLMIILAQNSTRFEDIIPTEIDDIVASAITEAKVTGEARDKLFELLAEVEKARGRGLSADLVGLLAASGRDDSFWVFLHNVLDKLGCFAMKSEEAWTQVCREIEQVDMIAVSLKFAEFLKMFLLIVNYKAGVLVNADTYVTSKRLLPRFYHIREWPMDNLDYMLQCLAACEHEEVTKFAIDTMISFINETKGLESKDVAPYLIEFFDSCDSHRAKARVIRLIVAYLDKKEATLDVRDFGVIRHKEKAKPNSIRITAEYKGKNYTFNVDQWSKPYDLKERIGRVIGEYASYITLYFNEISVASYSTLYHAGLRNGSHVRVSVTTNYGYRQPKADCPTLVFHEQGFSSKVCGLLEQSDDPVVLKPCRQILGRLPSNPEIIASLEDMPEFIGSLKKANDYMFGYRLAIFARGLGNPDTVKHFRENGGCEVVIQQLLDHPKGCPAMKDLLVIIEQLFCEIMTERAKELIPVILGLFPLAKEHVNVLANILRLFGDSDQESTTQITLESFDLLTSAIECVTYLSYPSFLKYIESLRNKEELSMMCLERMGSSQRKQHSYFNDILVTIVSDVQDEDSIKKIFKKCLEEFPHTQGEALGSLCQVISSILTTNPDMKEECKNMEAQMLPLAFKTTNNHLRDSILTLCEALNVIKEPNSLAFLRTMFEISTDRWNYRPLTNQQALEGFVGLRNLGSTCYMNSILQQLFYTFPFRYLLMTEESKDESQFELKRIFTELLLTSRKYSDTQKFCAVWKGWMKRPINPREQQDANEFLQLLLDQLPADVHSVFKGEIENKIEGINEDFTSSNFEMFYSICLDVKGFKDIHESFKSFIQSETFSGDNQISIGERKIDARKFARIKKAPKALVLQLKRFEYDLTTFARVKVNDRFEFAREINIQEYMSDPSDPQIYVLRGVVVHSGTAEGGHYSSLVLVDGQWMYFNDMEVSKVTEEEFESYTAGETSNYYTEYEAKPSAYMLFYTRKNATVEVADGTVLSFDKPGDIESKYDPGIVKAIEEEDAEYTRLQSVFCESMTAFVSKTQDRVILLEYFFNVFCHSSLTFNVNQMQQALDLLICDDSPEHRDLVQFVLDNYDRVEPIFVSCGVAAIMDLFLEFMRKLLDSAEVSLGFELMSKILSSLPVIFGASWKQSQYAAECLENGFLRRPEYVPLAQENHWEEKLVQFVSLVYEAQRSTMIYQNMNLSSVFLILAMLYAETHDEIVVTVMKYSPTILQSANHVHSFAKLLSEFLEAKAIDNLTYVNTLLQTKADSNAAYSALGELLLSFDDGQKVIEFCDSVFQKRGTKCDLLGFARYVRDTIDFKSTKELVIRYPQELLFRWLLSESDDIREEARSIAEQLRGYDTEHMTEDQTANVKMLFNAARSSMEKILSSEDGMGVFPGPTDTTRSTLEKYRLTQFLAVFRSVMKILNAFDEECFDLVHRFFVRLCEVRVDHYDYNLVECMKAFRYFPHEIIMPHFQSIFESTFAKMEKPAVADIVSYFPTFIPLIPHMTLEHTLFVLHSPVYPSIREMLLNGSYSGKKGFNPFTRKLLSLASEPECREEIVTIFHSIELCTEHIAPHFATFVGRAVEAGVLSLDLIKSFFATLPIVIHDVLAMSHWEIQAKSALYMGAAAVFLRFPEVVKEVNWSEIVFDVKEIVELFDAVTKVNYKPVFSCISGLCAVNEVEFTMDLLREIGLWNRVKCCPLVLVIYMHSGHFTDEEIVSMIQKSLNERDITVSDFWSLLDDSLVLTDPLPAWVMKALGLCVIEDSFHCILDDVPFLAKLIKYAKKEEIIEVLTVLVQEGPAFAEYEWAFVASLFKACPQWREDFLSVLPEKPSSWPRYSAEDIEEIYGREE